MGGCIAQMGRGQGGAGPPKTIKVVGLPKGNLISTVKLQVKTGTLTYDCQAQ